MNKSERENYFLMQEDELLLGGVMFSEWCTFISKSVYDAFVNGADLATIITAMTCIETYLRSEDPYNNKKTLTQLIDEAFLLDVETKKQLHILRRYRNGWVHADRGDDTEILDNEEKYIEELEAMSCLSIRMMFTVLFSYPFI